jgi:hypothetical protein
MKSLLLYHNRANVLIKYDTSNKVSEIIQNLQKYSYSQRYVWNFFSKNFYIIYKLFIEKYLSMNAYFF